MFYNHRKTTYYIRDAQGNPMATYKKSSETETASYKLIEHPIYGSSRVGIDNYTVEFVGYTVPSNGLTSRVLGLKQYELTNHLGNVLTTISDKKIPVENNGVVDYYVADITTVSDYYPFGSPMDGRTFYSEKYRFGFNGQEKDDEVAGAGNTNTAMFWEYDTRLGRRWNLDPVVKPWESPYACFANNPIFLIDVNGADTSFADIETGNQFNETYKSIETAINSFDEKIDNKLKRWKEKGYENEKFNQKMTRKIKRLNNSRSLLIELKSSFDEVIKSPIMYHYRAEPNPDGKYKNGGGTKYNNNLKRVEIWFYSGLGGTITHETRHGAGYSWSEWGWNNKTDLPTNYDYQDEYEAYSQQNIYNLVIEKQSWLSITEIIREIKEKYTQEYIIKEFQQYCE